MRLWQPSSLDKKLTERRSGVDNVGFQRVLKKLVFEKKRFSAGIMQGALGGKFKAFVEMTQSKSLSLKDCGPSMSYLVLTAAEAESLGSGTNLHASGERKEFPRFPNTLLNY